ncbi:hypothetical protein G7Y89_g9203 [Cudoniella acicularis]|uniref:Nephrocystin 3-like N-terminal domain-containing protein n=1 Tax=Cudoniella acicularis TaxID=354080 RepID=A0A8H4W0B3_9HELO|nr:hypothetical protein G7Y89_g9203 [Cudoniella acicularis]
MAHDDQDFVVLEDKDLADFNIAGLLPQSSGTLDQILKWLEPTDYAAESSEYNKHLASYVPGTGLWIQESDQYQEWFHSLTHGALWIKATAGAGKSVVATHITSLLAAKESVPVLSFYFRQIISTNRTPQALIRDWLAQLLVFSPPLQKQLKELLDQGRSLETIALDELWEFALSAMADCPRVYCVVDALDEMDSGNEDFIRKLVCLGQENFSSIKLVITSRPLPHIEKILTSPNIIQLALRPQLVDRDIAIYIKERLGPTEFSSEARAAIQEVLGRKSQGLFLYTRLMMDEILEAGFKDIQSLKNALQKLPDGLGDMYAKMLFDHSIRSGIPQDLQLFILKCVTLSSRPLRLLELSTLVDFVRKSPRTHFAPNVPPSIQGTKSIVRAACGPLLEILEDETVSIIHHSLTEFLTSSRKIVGSPLDFPSIKSTEAHLDIAKTCIDYLLSDGLSDWDSIKNTTEAGQERINVARLKNPFLDYSTKYWMYHVLRCEKADEDLFKLLDSLLDTKSTLFSSYLEFGYPKLLADKTSALHIAATCGLTIYTRHLLQAGHDTDLKGQKSRTPLHQAASKGFEETVEELLIHGAAPCLDDYAGEMPIHLAASRNHSKVVRVLLKSGVDPLAKRTRNPPGRRGGRSRSYVGITPLQYACEYGHTETVLEFLPYLDDKSLNMALLWALRYGKPETAAMILDNTGVDVNWVVNSRTPIHLAAWSHDLKSFRNLINRGANLMIELEETEDRYYMERHGPPLLATPWQTFLQFSSGHGVPLKAPAQDSFEILKIMVNAGCDLNELNKAGHTAFHLILDACKVMDPKISQEIIQYLFQNGADSSIVTEDGSTALHLMPPNLDSAIESLVSSGIDVNSRRSSDGKTPLFGAIGDEKYVSTFINLGADCNAQDLNGDTPLHIAIQTQGYGETSEHAAAIKALLNAGADPKRKNKSGLAPLHVIKDWSERKEALLALIAAGADLEDRVEKGLTVLLWGLKNGSYKWDIQTLLDVGCDINARDFSGKTVLHYCCDREQGGELLRKFCERGVDPTTSRDYSGNTLFHQVARQPASSYEKEQLALLEALLELGVSPQLVNNSGQTPLHIAAGKRDSLIGYQIGKKKSPLEFLLGPKCNLDINAPDNLGIRAIHLAATLGEDQVKELLRHGADPMVVTIEGQTVLHVAARSRQSNVVGLMTDLYIKLGKTEIIDQVDKDGRTALHYAARSGRPESVSILINLGGANPNATDIEGLTPLDMCTYIREEDSHWSKRFNINPEPYISAVGVTLDDPYRTRWVYDSESDTISSRQIIKFLILHNADVSIMHSKSLRKHSYGPSSLFKLAIDNDCEVLVEELLEVEKNHPPEPTPEPTDSDAESDDGTDDDNNWRYKRSPWDQFQEKFVSARIQNADLLQGLVKSGKTNIALFRRLVKNEHEKGIEKFKTLGADMLTPGWDGESCISFLVKGGHSSILEKFGEEIASIAESSSEKTKMTDVSLQRRPQLLLLMACERKLPNIEVIKVLVKFGVDVNVQSGRDNPNGSWYEGRTALHILATCTYWWNFHALDYLLDHGADPHIKDKDGNTPLHIAVNNGSEVAVESLLRHGADPNAVNNGQLTCVHGSGSSAVILGLLLRHGANASAGAKPFVFNCIEAMDISTINILVEMKTNFNIRLPPAEEPEAPVDGDDPRQARRARFLWWQYHDREAAETSYPIHFAAGREFATKEHKQKMIPIIEALLKGGADPMLVFNDEGDSILHDICLRDGILEPFLKIPHLDLEARDSKGRTLLLAACTTDPNWFNGEGAADGTWGYSQSSKVQLLLDQGADMRAVDNVGRNVLYHLLTSYTSYKSMQAHHPDDLQMILAHDLAPKLVIQKDKSGTTPLQHALQIGQFSAIDPLLLRGADPLEPDPDQNTALHHLAARSTTFRYEDNPTAPLVAALFEKFLSLGVDINARNSLGETALSPFIAAIEISVGQLKVFEEHGADLRVVNRKGQGLLHAAAKAGKPEIFKYLMEKGLDPMGEDEEDRSALDFATASGCEAILEIFKREK